MSQETLNLLGTLALALAIIIAYVEPRYRKLKSQNDDQIEAGWQERLKLKDDVITDQQSQLKDAQKELSYEQNQCAQFKEAASEAQKTVDLLQNKLAIAQERLLRQETMYKNRLDELRADFDTMSKALAGRDKEIGGRVQLQNLIEQLQAFLADHKGSSDGNS